VAQSGCMHGSERVVLGPFRMCGGCGPARTSPLAPCPMPCCPSPRQLPARLPIPFCLPPCRLSLACAQSVLPMLLSDLVKQKCDYSVEPACVDDPERSWLSTTQFYTGLGLVQVWDAV